MSVRFALWRLAQSSAPIIIGPWTSEVGFEVSYFLPWLLQWRTEYHIPKDRLIALSRGGAGVWYDAGQSVELLQYVPLETLRKAALARAKATGSIKQQGLASWESTLLPHVASDLGLRRYAVLHPSLMYRDLGRYWKTPLGQGEVVKGLLFAPPPVPSPPLRIPLPEKYVAVRFYARGTWPLAEDLRIWVQTYVENLAKHIPVVVLDSGLHTDDHLDFPISGPNILNLAPYVTPQDNLAVQSAVLAKAQGFVGTYGGTMQLAVRLRKPSMGFYQQFTGTAYAHKQLTEWLAVQQGTPCFIGRPQDAQYVKEALQI